MEENSSKAILSLLNIILIVVPLISMIFTTIHYYNSYEFIELMLSQPMSRRKILLSEYGGVALSLLSSFYRCRIPVLVYSPDSIDSHYFTGIFNTCIYIACLSYFSKSKRKAGYWFYFIALGFILR
jgi:Cu-processing system permease protein